MLCNPIYLMINHGLFKRTSSLPTLRQTTCGDRHWLALRGLSVAQLYRPRPQGLAHAQTDAESEG